MEEFYEILQPHYNLQHKLYNHYDLLFVFILQIGGINLGYLESPRINPPFSGADIGNRSPLATRRIYITRKLNLLQPAFIYAQMKNYFNPPVTKSPHPIPPRLNLSTNKIYSPQKYYAKPYFSSNLIIGSLVLDNFTAF